MNLTPEQEELSHLIHGDPDAPRPQGIIYMGGGVVAFAAALAAEICQEIQKFSYQEEAEKLCAMGIYFSAEDLEQMTIAMNVSRSATAKFQASIEKASSAFRELGNRLQYPDDERLPLRRRLFLAMKRGFEMSKSGGTP